jgi:4-aminobutyrate aminotransferase-like enzyme
MDVWPPSTGEALHTSTFLGNPMGCAMALASLAEHAKPETTSLVQIHGRRLKSALEKIQSPHIWHIRGRGLMLGVELIKTDGTPFTELAIAIVKRALQDGILVLADSPESNVLSITPPFSIDDEEIAFVAAKLQEYLTLLPGSIS